MSYVSFGRLPLELGLLVDEDENRWQRVGSLTSLS